MPVADYVLAVLCILLCLVWAGLSFLIAAIDSFVPAPGVESARLGRAGCVSLVLALLASAWFVGVIWNGEWGWL